ncbi:MAG: ABC transporter ATP-binding protein [candidate division WOR-3 bacterium]
MAKSSEVVIECKDLRKSFKADLFRKTNYAVKGVNFRVYKNESFGIIGLNGAGKSTTIKVILGLIKPDSGNVKVLGKNPSSYGIREKISYLPENPNFYENLKGYEFLMFVAKLRGLRGKQAVEEVEKWLYKVGLEKEGGKMLRKYSRGMLQRIGLAQAFLGETELIILDEPLNSLDPMGRRMARDLIWEKLQGGSTILFTSHILEDIEKICDRVAIMHDGKVIQIIEVNQVDEKLEDIFLRTIREHEEKN